MFLIWIEGEKGSRQREPFLFDNPGEADRYCHVMTDNWTKYSKEELAVVKTVEAAHIVRKYEARRAELLRMSKDDLVTILMQKESEVT